MKQERKEKFGDFSALRLNLCPHSSSSKELSVPPVTAVALCPQERRALAQESPTQHLGPAPRDQGPQDPPGTFGPTAAPQAGPSRRRLGGSGAPAGKPFQLLHPRRPRQTATRPPANYEPPLETSPPPDTRLFVLFLEDFSPPRLTGPRNCPPPASLQSRGGKAAPVTSLRDGSPTRRTPVKPQPDPFRRLCPRSRIRTPVTLPRPRPALRRGGDTEGPSSRGPAPGEDAPPPGTAAPAPTHPPGALPARRPSRRLGSLTWPEAGPRGRCPVRGPPREAAAAAPGARRLRRRLSGGFSAA